MAAEIEREYASKGVAGAGLGTGIGGLALGVLNTAGTLGALAMSNKAETQARNSNCGGSEAAIAAMVSALAAAAGLTGRNGTCNEDHTVNRYEAAQAARIAELETEVKLRDANTYTDGKLLEVYQYVDGRLRGVEGQISQQAVYNATNTAALSCMQGQIAQLMSLTKMVIPNSSVCPGWGEATVTVPTGTTTS